MPKEAIFLSIICLSWNTKTESPIAHIFRLILRIESRNTCSLMIRILWNFGIRFSVLPFLPNLPFFCVNKSFEIAQVKTIHLKLFKFITNQLIWKKYPCDIKPLSCISSRLTHYTCNLVNRNHELFLEVSSRVYFVYFITVATV